MLSVNLRTRNYKEIAILFIKSIIKKRITTFAFKIVNYQFGWFWCMDVFLYCGLTFVLDDSS